VEDKTPQGRREVQTQVRRHGHDGESVQIVLPYEVYRELLATVAIYACDCEERAQCGIEYKSHSYCGRAARELVDKIKERKGNEGREDTTC
jgi:hypothetical protein